MKMSLWAVNNSIKCVVVGDGCVGKTCLLISYALNKFPSDHVPTVFDSYACNVMAGDETYTVCLFDTAGQEEYDRLRVLAYPGSDVFLVCFSLVEPSSLQNVSQVWVPEIKKHCGEKVRFFLVGTKEDLRTDMQVINSLQKKKEKPVTWEQGNKMAKAVGAQGYIECSALTQKGLRNVFNEALLAVLEPEQKPESKKSGLRGVFGACLRGK